MPPPGLQICLQPRVTLTFDLLTPKDDRSMHSPVDHLCPFAAKSARSFSEYCVQKFGNRRTHGRTGRYVTPALTSMAWRRHKHHGRPQAWARGGTCSPLGNVQARFASVTTFRFAKKRSKIVATRDTFHGLRDCAPDPAAGAYSAPRHPHPQLSAPSTLATTVQPVHRWRQSLSCCWSPGLEQSATGGHISAITGHPSQAFEDSSVHRVIFEHTTIVTDLTSVSGPCTKSLLRPL